MKLKKLLATVATAAVAVLAFAACSPKSGSNSTSKQSTLKVGIMTRNDYTTAVWNKVAELAAKKNVKLELTEFTDYSQPNKALANGDVDVNAFQHIYFLNNWNKENNGDLQVAAYTIYSPIRLYSGLDGDKERYTKVDDFPNGAQVGVPNDATNESRALYLLESVGLIKLDVKDNALATLSDISENPKNIKIQELDASQLVRARGSLDGAVINNNYAQQAGMDTNTAIYVEEKSAVTEQWYNVIAAQNGWEKSDKADAIKVLIEAYNNDEVGKVIEEASAETDFPVWDEMKK